VIKKSRIPGNGKKEGKGGGGLSPSVIEERRRPFAKSVETKKKGGGRCGGNDVHPGMPNEKGRGEEGFFAIKKGYR